MSYPAHVTDTVYRYDGTFQGFLCCIFESYSRKEIPAAVCAPDRGQISLYDSCEIVTDPARAQRVARGLERLGPTVKERITTGFLSDDPEHELILLRFARICFEKGPAAARATGDPDICAAFDLERAVNNEACKYIEFIRFEQRGMMLGTVIHPKNRILPLLRGHFCSRLPDEDFMIFDATRGIAMLRRDRKVQYMVMEHYDKNTGQEELDWQKLPMAIINKPIKISITYRLEVTSASYFSISAMKSSPTGTLFFKQNISQTAFQGSAFSSSSRARRWNPCPFASYSRNFAIGSSKARVIHFCAARLPIT